jgi:cell fate regulator YaaT (PSP1 superfamily)
MATQHLIRVGAMGQVGRFAAVDAVRYPRGAEVVVRTRRGLEIGQVLSEPNGSSPEPDRDGEILRGVTVEDQLLQNRLEQNRDSAFAACQALLGERELQATLLDVEQLFDGQKLFFYFLGDVDPRVEALTAELAEAYEAKVQMRKFSETLLEGCGPDCGTEAGGGGCDSCTTCAVAGACSTTRK